MRHSDVRHECCGSSVCWQLCVGEVSGSTLAVAAPVRDFGDEERDLERRRQKSWCIMKAGTGSIGSAAASQPTACAPTGYMMSWN